MPTHLKTLPSTPTSTTHQQQTQQCRDQLRQRIKTQENLQAYPGQIYLPVSLFQLKPTGAAAPSPGGSLAEGEDGDGGGFLDDDEGPDADWGLSPIPVDVSHLGGGAGRRRRSGVRLRSGGRL